MHAALPNNAHLPVGQLYSHEGKLHACFPPYVPIAQGVQSVGSVWFSFALKVPPGQGLPVAVPLPRRPPLGHMDTLELGAVEVEEEAGSGPTGGGHQLLSSA